MSKAHKVMEVLDQNFPDSTSAVRALAWAEILAVFDEPPGGDNVTS